jgi:hypothetical protein
VEARTAASLICENARVETRPRCVKANTRPTTGTGWIGGDSDARRLPSGRRTRTAAQPYAALLRPLLSGPPTSHFAQIARRTVWTANIAGVLSRSCWRADLDESRRMREPRHEAESLRGRAGGNDKPAHRRLRSCAARHGFACSLTKSSSARPVREALNRRYRLRLVEAGPTTGPAPSLENSATRQEHGWNQ